MELASKTNEVPSELPKHDFQKTVAEAKQAVEAEGQKKVRKGRSDKGRARKPSTDAGPGLSTQPSAPGASAPQSIDISQYLAVPIAALSTLPAKKHGIPELALTAEESKACAEAINGIFNAFVPNINQMSPKTAAIMGAVMVFGSIGFTKYQIFAEVQEAKRLKAAPETPGNQKEVIPSAMPLDEGKISAFDHMRR